MKKYIFILLALAGQLSASAQENSTFCRFPALNPEGNTIAFSFQGDIWTMPLNGDRPNRITIHEAYESLPKWSPDGSRLGFSSNRFGNNDIYTIPAEGGLPKRLSFHSANDILRDWTAGGELIFESSRNFRQVEWEAEALSVSPEGGTPERIMDAMISEPAISPNGRFVACVLGNCRKEREQYHGSANRDIWIYDREKESYTQITEFEGQDYQPVWGGDTKLYFIGAKSGKYNIFSIAINQDGEKDSEPVQLSNETNDQIRYFDVNEEAGIIVYEKDVNLYTMPVNGGASNKLDIKIASDYRFDPYEYKTLSSGMGKYAISPNGKYSAYIAHGEVFITENNKDKNLTRNISNSPFREKDVAWLNDSALVFSSDRKGQFDLYLAVSSDPKQGNIFKSLKHKLILIAGTEADERAASISPDGNKITWIKGGEYGHMNFMVAKIDKEGKISKEIKLIDSWNAPSGVAWSPDSKWLAYSHSDLSFNEEIFIHAADGSMDAVNISMHPRGDHSPVWSRDGSKLGFISARNNRDDDIWFVWLTKEDSEKTNQEWKEEEGDIITDMAAKKKPKKKTEKEAEEKKETVKAVEIDFEDIHERLVQLTSLSGNESGLAIDKDGKTFYFSSLGRGRTVYDLYSVKWNGKELKSVSKCSANPGQTSLDPTGKYLYINSGGRLTRVNITGGNKKESIPFSGKLLIDYTTEREQVFEEAWRALSDGFYDPDFHGNDWDALKTKFKPYCMAASTNTDFRYMFNIMLGQLNASHMGMYGSDRENVQSEKTGLLGIDAENLPRGLKIIRVIPESPADRTKSKLENGDIIISVNGESVSTQKNFWAMLNNTANEQVLLEVEAKDGKTREVVIRPATSLGSQLYNEWVKERRKLTGELSGGRLGYLHIKGMDMPSFERFERELTAAGNGKEAIVIDVRYNGGGWTTDYLMAILNVKQHAYTIPRGAEEDLSNKKKYRDYYPFAERLPFFVWNKPSIALCNSYSYSNAEIFSHAYKNLGIGTLVGTPTFGAVISTGGVGLMDGSFVRMPFRGWFVKADDKNMDKEAAIPDVIVRNAPDYKSEKGEDLQLKKAVEILLKQLDAK